MTSASSIVASRTVIMLANPPDEHVPACRAARHFSVLSPFGEKLPRFAFAGSTWRAGPVRRSRRRRRMRGDSTHVLSLWGSTFPWASTIMPLNSRPRHSGKHDDLDQAVAFSHRCSLTRWSRFHGGAGARNRGERHIDAQGNHQLRAG